MEVRHFKLIQTVAETGSLTRAADKLCLTQSALSHQLRDLEDQLKTKVFSRKKNALILTSSGKTLLKSASVILNEIAVATSAIQKLTSGEVGRIRLSTECNTCYHWLPAILKQLHAIYPNVDIRLNTAGTKSPIDLLTSGKVDLAIVYRKKQSKGILYSELFRDDVVAILPVNHPLAGKKYLTPKDFRNETYITHSTELEKSIFYQQFLKPARTRPRRVLHIHLTEAALAIVREGLGITVMAKWLVEPYVDPSKLRMLPLSRSGLRRQWYLAAAKESLGNSYVRDFIDLIRHGLTRA